MQVRGVYLCVMANISNILPADLELVLLKFKVLLGERKSFQSILLHSLFQNSTKYTGNHLKNNSVNLAALPIPSIVLCCYMVTYIILTVLNICCY